MGCSSDGETRDSAATTTPAAAAEPDIVARYLDDRGVLSFEGAEALFAASLMPLPGVEPAPTAALDADTSVLETMLSHRAALTTEQAQVLDAVLGLDGAGDTTATGGAARSLRRPSGERADLANAILEEAKPFFAARLGRSIDDVEINFIELPMVDSDGTRHFADAGEAAVATRVTSGVGGPYVACDVRLNLDAAYGAARFRSQVSHEIYHCFQYVLGDPDGHPIWVKEGEAAYAGELFAGGSSASERWWLHWIQEPTTRLEERRYDAIGLFSLSQRLGADPFTYFDALWDTETLATIVRAAGPDLLDLWGTHLFNDPSWGEDFTVTGPGANSLQAAPLRIDLVTDGPPATFPALPSGNAANAYSFYAPGDVLVVTSTGHGGIRFADGQHARFGGAFAQSYCLRPAGCACPSGPTVREITPADANGFIGVGPGDYPQVVTQSLARWCADDAALVTSTTTGTTGSLAECVRGTWRSTAIVVPGQPGSTTTFTGGDGVLFTLTPDGVFTIDYAGMTPIEGTFEAGSAGSGYVTVVFTGQGSGQWQIDASGAVTGSVADLTAVRAASSVTFAGVTTPIFDMSLAEITGAPGGAGVYTLVSCTATTLTMTTSFTGGSATYTATRVS
jgi:hypothetical protein